MAAAKIRRRNFITPAKNRAIVLLITVVGTFTSGQTT
jgi:hypothetical protein